MLVLIGCSKENLVGIKSSNKGSVALKINNTNTPSDVQVISAFMSRENYDTLKTSIEINNDSLNVLSFKEIAVGSWHLLVEAKNSAGKIIYSGETDVTIIEDQTINIYLTLTPTGSGTGNINIFIEWGSSWEDYRNNPVFDKNSSPTNPYGVAYSAVIYDNNMYKMWYTNLYTGAETDIAYSESVDGINWKNTVSPVLSKGQPGSWDDFKVAIAGIIKNNQQYEMYYIGIQGQYDEWSVGLAIS